VKIGKIDDAFTKSTIHSCPDDVLHEKEPIELKDIFIFDEKEKNKCILIEAGPGLGKTMLSIKICKDWASGVLLQRYELVILLLLRCCKQAKCVEDLFPHESEGDKNDIVRELYETEGSKVCFIADGFDELPPESQNSSIFIDLVKKFTDSMIIYTSRPIAAEKLRQQVVGRRIEIIGFKSEQVQEYIEKTLIDLSSQDQQSANVGKEKATELMKLIDSHPFIWKLVHIPINLAIITHIFHLKRSLPLSHSELYTSLVLSTILRYLCERKPVGTRNLDNFDQLPKIERKQFDNVCLLAFQGLQNSKVTFSTRRVRLYNLPDEINRLGLLNFVPFLAEHGTIQSLHFMHLTLQEFCAAFHISKLLKPDQYDAFVKHRDDPTFQVVWQFFAGLNKFTTRRIFASMIPSSNVYSPLYKSDVVQLLLCLYEANANMLCGEAIYFMNGVIDLSYFEMDLLLYTALAYFVSNCSPGSIKVINVGWCGIGDEGLHAISEALMQSYHCDSCAVKLQHKNPLDLDVSYNDLTGAGAHYISKLLSSPCLVGKLVCTGNHKLGDDGVEAIVQSTIGKNTLKILELRRCGIGIKGIKAVGELLKSTSNLETLDISESNIDTKMLTLLSEPFIKNCSLTTLKLKWCTFGQDFNVFVNALSSSSLLNLDLQHSDLSSAGIGRIVHALKRNPYLKSLNLDSTGITDGGVFHISELIAESNSLSELYISNNFQDQGIEGICDTIVKPNSFHTLGIMPCTMSLKEQSSVALSKVLTSASITSLRIIPPENC